MLLGRRAAPAVGSHGGVDACELYHCQGAGITLNVPVVAGGKGAEVRSAGATVELRRR